LEQTWPDGTPLWFYVLKEAEHRGGGDRLGPVGGRIVGEVLVGVLLADPEAFTNVDPAWQPSLPAESNTYAISDLLAIGTPTKGGA
jgi:hypothetical protein